MKSRKAIILVTILIIFTAIAAIFHLGTRQEVPKNVLQISVNGKEHIIDISKLKYEQVTGIRINGKGEEIPVDEQGVSLESILKQQSITEYSKVTVIADDSYSANLSADEVKEDGKAYLVVQEEEGLRLVVFEDENSKRSVSNVVQIVVE